MKALILFLAQLGILGSLEAKDCFFENKKFDEEDFFAEARFYPVTGSLKTIIILPPTGGTNMIDRSYARLLCASGYNVYILDKYTGYDEYNLDLEIHRRYYGRTQRAVDLLVKDVPDTHHLSIMGTSVGALHAAISAGRVDRIRNALIITGGADITGLIVDSDQEVMKVAREKRNKMFGFKTRDDYYNELKKHIELDPLNYETKFSGKKISMVIADNDTTVPGNYQRLLQKIARPTRTLEMSDNHFWAIVKTWLFHRDFVVKSFQ
ncbi:MAG: hypothetical protein V4598_06650 [Bdellovibrionota bacterium]